MFLSKKKTSVAQSQTEVLAKLALPRHQREKLVNDEEHGVVEKKVEPVHTGLTRTQYKKYMYDRVKLVTKNQNNLFKNFTSFKKHKLQGFGQVTSIQTHPQIETQWLFARNQSADIHYNDEGTKKSKIYQMPSRATSCSVAKFRADGAMFAAAGKGTSSHSSREGIVAVFRSMESARARVPIRIFGSHKGEVRSVHFPSETYLLSGSTDVQYHILTQTINDNPLVVLKHDDYTTSIDSISPNLIVTGCADHFVRVWDLRQNSATCVRSWKMNAAVRGIAVSSSGKVIGAGDGISVWDIGYEENIWGGDEVVSVACRGDSIIAGSLDGSVRIWDVNNGDLRFEKTFGNPVLCADMSIDQKRIYISLNDKTVLKAVREDPLIPQKAEAEEAITADNYRTLISPVLLQTELNKETRSTHLDLFSKYLDSFRYKDGLNYAIRYHGDKPEKVVAFITELLSRNELLNALDARNEKSLAPILKFLADNVTDLRYYRILTTVANNVVAIYGDTIGQSGECDKWWKIMNAKIEEEIDSLRNAAKIKGVMDMLIRSTQLEKKE